MALTCLLDMRALCPNPLKTLAGPWQTQSEFNVFLASKVIQPLTGGMCIINSVKDKTAITNSYVKLPADFDLKGIEMVWYYCCIFCSILVSIPTLYS